MDSQAAELLSERLLKDGLTRLLGKHVDLEQLPPKEAEQLLEIVPPGAFITYAHKVLLGKTPGPEMLLTATNWHREGRSRGEIAAKLLAMSSFNRPRRLPSGSDRPLDAFIREAYQNILGRAADEEGMRTYMRRGRKLGGRRKILASLRSSAEGRHTQGGRLERVAGLRRLIRAGKLANTPAIGFIFARSRAKRQRLIRMELSLAAMMPRTIIQGEGAELLAMLCEAFAVSGPPAELEPVAAPPDLGSATEADIDNWIFQTTVRGVRRQLLVANGGEH